MATMDGCVGFEPCLISTRMRPGFAQSFGCIFPGSKTISCRGLKPRSIRASTIVRARGLSTESDLFTRRPSARDRVLSKYTGYRHWKFFVRSFSAACCAGFRCWLNCGCTCCCCCWLDDCGEARGTVEDEEGMSDGRMRDDDGCAKSNSLGSISGGSESESDTSSTLAVRDIVFWAVVQTEESSRRA